MTRYEVIESRRWQDNAGRTASIYGALPWFSDAQRVAEGWQMVTVGYTVRNLSDGTVGIGKVPWKTREEAQAWVNKQPCCNKENRGIEGGCGNCGDPSL